MVRILPQLNGPIRHRLKMLLFSLFATFIKITSILHEFSIVKIIAFEGLAAEGCQGESVVKTLW